MSRIYVSPLAHGLANAILQDQVNYRMAKEDAANLPEVVAVQCENDGVAVPPIGAVDPIHQRRRSRED